ncbi:MBL fold metallo-hydrolase [Candidatus Saccharibacteria bacterium]|nr:MBL fold metallo-hydrolase [Candidatus Saccharibacteria bacterium]
MVEKNNQSIVVDPGSDSFDLIIPTNAQAILFTHEHDDHASVELTQKIIDSNPQVALVGTKGTMDKFSHMPKTIIDATTELPVGDFMITAYFGEHDLVHSDLSRVENVGYYIDSTVFYGGDTIATIPAQTPKILAVPIASNWAKFSDVIDYVRKIKPTYAVPVHDRLLSDTGRKVADRHMENLTKNYGITYMRPVGAIEIDE